MTLAKQFAHALSKIAAESSKIYNPSRMNSMIARMGAVGAAKNILVKNRLGYGFVQVAYERKRKDLTIEHLVATNPQFHPLFTAEEVAVAKQRIDEAPPIVPSPAAA